MKIPHFRETNHPLVKSIAHYSDQNLLTLFQRYPEQGKYFIAIVGRYSSIVYTLISHSARSPVQADYLFVITWRHIFYEMRGLNLRNPETTEVISFQNWLINQIAFCINPAYPDSRLGVLLLLRSVTDYINTLPPETQEPWESEY